MRVSLYVTALSIYFFSAYFVSCHANDAKNVALVGSNLYQNMLHRIEGTLFAEPSPRPNIVRIDPTQEKSMARLSALPFDLIVTLGPESTESVLKTKETRRILSILVNRHTFESLRQRYPHEQFTAIFLNHPIGRQLNLVQHLMLPSEKQMPLGVILGPDSATGNDTLQHEALERNLILKTVNVNENETPINALGLVLSDTSFLLALPDEHVFNPRTARGILLATFRKKVPLIGYTRTYVGKGALAAVYSTPAQIASEVSCLILQIIDSPSRKLPMPRYPKTFKVTVNYQAARSLERTVDSEAAIQYALEKMERISPEGKYCSVPTQTMSRKS